MVTFVLRSWLTSSFCQKNFFNLLLRFECLIFNFDLLDRSDDSLLGHLFFWLHWNLSDILMIKHKFCIFIKFLFQLPSSCDHFLYIFLILAGYLKWFLHVENIVNFPGVIWECLFDLFRVVVHNVLIHVSDIGIILFQENGSSLPIHFIQG